MVVAKLATCIWRHLPRVTLFFFFFFPPRLSSSSFCSCFCSCFLFIFSVFSSCSFSSCSSSFCPFSCVLFLFSSCACSTYSSSFCLSFCVLVLVYLRHYDYCFHLLPLSGQQYLQTKNGQAGGCSEKAQKQ